MTLLAGSVLVDFEHVTPLGWVQVHVGVTESYGAEDLIY